MSSRKAATSTKTSVRATPKAGGAAKATAPKSAAETSATAPASASEEKPAAPGSEAIAADAAASVSNDAAQLAARIERDLRDGRVDTLTPEAFQALMTALCKSYGAQREAGAEFLPVGERSVSPTEVMTTTSALLKAANLAVFELGMWQSWTGR